MVLAFIQQRKNMEILIHFNTSLFSEIQIIVVFIYITAVVILVIFANYKFTGLLFK